MKQLIDYIAESVKLFSGEYEIKLPSDFPITITIESKVTIEHTSKYSDDYVKFILNKVDFTNLIDAIQGHRQYSVWLDPTSKDRKFFDHITIKYEPKSDNIVLHKHPKDPKMPYEKLEFYGHMLEPIINA